jgi:glycine oxidase
MLAPVTETDFGEERSLRLNLAGRERWPAFAAELEERSGLPTGYRESGALVVAADRDDAEALRRLHELQLSLSLDAEWLTPSACRRLEPGLSPRIAGGIFAPQDAHADPEATVRALAAVVEEIALGAVVEGIEHDGERVTGVRTAAGSIRCDQVVVAAGAWSPALAPAGAGPPVRPVKGQILSLRSGAAQPLCERIVATDWVYVVPRVDGRVVVGATVEERGVDLTVTAGGVHELLREAYRVLPDIAELELTAAVAGLRPGTPDNAPLIGHGALEGLVLATGHYRNGILLAPITADAVAALLAGETPPAVAERFAVERFQEAVAP